MASANKVDSKGGNTPKVKLRGLPYGSTTADVYNFFRGFGVIDGSVTFGVNSEGRPSGEAWVSFVKLEDARRAVREKDRHHMVSVWLSGSFEKFKREGRDRYDIIAIFLISSVGR